MGNYTGTAVLILADGSRAAGAVNLHKRIGGLESWDGTFRPHDPTIDLFNSVGMNLPLELPSGQTGEALLQSHEGGITGPTIIRLAGSGPAPF